MGAAGFESATFRGALSGHLWTGIGLRIGNASASAYEGSQPLPFSILPEHHLRIRIRDPTGGGTLMTEHRIGTQEGGMQSGTSC
jgi:hypothetical protein